MLTYTHGREEDTSTDGGLSWITYTIIHPSELLSQSELHNSVSPEQRLETGVVLCAGSWMRTAHGNAEQAGRTEALPRAAHGAWPTEAHTPGGGNQVADGGGSTREFQKAISLSFLLL